MHAPGSMWHWGTNMEKIFFCAKTNGFYPEEFQEQYVDAGTWPEDLTEVSQEQYQLLIGAQSHGKIIVPDEDGYPVLSDPETDFTAVAVQRRDSEMALASARINALTDAQDDGDITPEEVEELAALREKRTRLRRLDLTTAPDIDWPE